MEETNDTLCVGIDLGTSRSSISASNGERHVVDSYVGWPLDMVARKLAKKLKLWRIAPCWICAVRSNAV